MKSRLCFLVNLLNLYKTNRYEKENDLEFASLHAGERIDGVPTLEQPTPRKQSAKTRVMPGRKLGRDMGPEETGSRMVLDKQTYVENNN